MFPDSFQFIEFTGHIIVMANKQNSFNCQEESRFSPFANTYLNTQYIYSLCQEEAVIMVPNKLENPNSIRKGCVYYTCETCGKVFAGIKARKRRFCSKKCYLIFRTPQKEILICIVRGSMFEKRNPSRMSTNECCSKKCYGILRTTPKETLVCKECGAPFTERASGTNEYCSRKCAMASRKIHPKTAICEQCGKTFKVNSRRVAKFCSIVCVGKAHVGKNHYRFNESDRIKTCKYCNKQFVDTHVKSNRKYCSRECYFLANSGENHWYYNPDSHINGYPIEFNTRLKNYIRRRDNYTCQMCQKTESIYGQKLDVHHIDYDKSNSNTFNLISLCKNCHMHIHTNDNAMQEHLIGIVETNENKIKKLV